MENNYNLSDLSKCWDKLNIKKGDLIYVTGDLSYLGSYYNRKQILNDYYKTLSKAVGKNGTIAFPTHSWSLLNRGGIFSLKNTPSETGVLTEYLRKKKNNFRQFHPFSSTSAIGKFAKYITESKSKHVNGLDSPFEKIIKLKGKFISIGMPPNTTCTHIHHIELINNVPYRFIKEFKVRIKKKRITLENFFLFVCYKEIKAHHRDRNKKIFLNFKKKNKIFSFKLGKGSVYQYSMHDFYQETMKLMKNDIYVWLKKKPKIKKWISKLL